MEQQTFIFFGRSGCGKGTQAKLLIEYLAKNDPERKTLFIETGKLMRDLSEGTTLTSNNVRNILEKGGLQPEFLPIYLWSGMLINNLTGYEHIVCDGVSRRLPEAPVLDSAFRFYNRKKPKVILIDVSPEWSSSRLLLRGRYDDNKEEIEKRMKWFEENTMPAIEFFKNDSGYHFYKINGEQTIEKVHADIIKMTAI